MALPSLSNRNPSKSVVPALGVANSRVTQDFLVVNIHEPKDKGSQPFKFGFQNASILQERQCLQRMQAIPLLRENWVFLEGHHENTAQETQAAGLHNVAQTNSPAGAAQLIPFF